MYSIMNMAIMMMLDMALTIKLTVPQNIYTSVCIYIYIYLDVFSCFLHYTLDPLRPNMGEDSVN
jgi:hypothetical protein